MNRYSLIFPTLFALAASIGTASAADAFVARPSNQVDTIALAEDLQDVDRLGEKMELVWWIPKEYMAAALAQSADKPEAKTAREMTELFDKYTLVAVVSGEIGGMLEGSFESEESLRDKIRILDQTGKEYAPLGTDKIDYKMAMLIGVLRPMFKQLLGEMGQNMQLFVFPGELKKGQRIANPLGTGNFVIRLGENRHVYRLPLGSLLVPQKDPATGEVFPGNFSFNPYTGAPLQTQAP